MRNEITVNGVRGGVLTLNVSNGVGMVRFDTAPYQQGPQMCRVIGVEVAPEDALRYTLLFGDERREVVTLSREQVGGAA